MKRILLSAVLLLACGAVQAQFNIRVYNMSEVLKAKPIDKVLFTAQYDLSFVGDTAHEDKHIDETMMLKVGSKVPCSTAMPVSVWTRLSKWTKRPELRRKSSRNI